MAKFKVVKLKNLTPTHIGIGKNNYDFSADNLKSDTISSALAAMRAQRGEVDDIEQFLLSFSVSSAFPFYKAKYFLPKMQGKVSLKIEGQEEHVYRKKLKGVKYIESTLWSKLAEGHEVLIKDEQISKGFVVADLKHVSISESQVSQRVSVPRGDDSMAEPFFFEWNFFNSDAGLYVLVDCDDDRFEELLSLFEDLGQIGVGTDKSVGGGKFDIEQTELGLPDISSSTHMAMLSMYIPEYSELQTIDLEQSRYDLLLRGGFIAGSNNIDFRHLRKKSVYMFNTGSVLSTSSRLKGRVVNLRPEWNDDEMHPIYRSGKPFCIPVKMNSYE